LRKAGQFRNDARGADCNRSCLTATGWHVTGGKTGRIGSNLTYKNAFERNNAISVFLMGALPAVAGSAISVMLVSFMVWAIISLAFRRFRFDLTPHDRLIAWTFTAFVGVVLATALLGENPEQIPWHTLWLLPFLSVWVVIPRLRATPDLNYLHLFAVGAAVGAVGALLVGLVQVVGFDQRAEGGAGNAAVFGIISLCLAAIAGLNLDDPRRNYRMLAVAGIVAGLLAVVISLTRGVAIVAIGVLIVLVIYAPRQQLTSKTRIAWLGLVAVVAAALYGAADLIADRLLLTVEELNSVVSGGSSANIGERLRLWIAGWSAIGESPLWGHGIQNRMAKVSELLVRDGLPVQDFTHAHNAFITFAIDGGIIVLGAVIAVLTVPVFVAWRAPRDTYHRKRFFLALQMSLIFGLCGLTQIMFKHDIMDAFYIFSVMVVASSIVDLQVRKGTKTPTSP
jgi:O-antigen ligase